MMNINIIEYLNELLTGTKITELTIKRRDDKISINRDPEKDAEKTKGSAGSRAKQDKKQGAAESASQTGQENLVKVLSKTVGVFYRGKTKLAPPLVRIDSVVKKGDQLGFINSMGVIEKVTAPTAGIVREVLADSHKPVEYGQPLYVIEAKS